MIYNIEQTLENMETYGGGFVKQLAILYLHADYKNKMKLEQTFSELFEQYDKFKKGSEK